jgi:hypothetical protein
VGIKDCIGAATKSAKVSEKVMSFPFSQILGPACEHGAGLETILLERIGQELD